MKIAIMQPYFLPYIGYWQLMNAVDQFVVYDNIEYTKKGWINRNRLLQNSAPEIFTVPVARAPDNLHVVQREIAETYNPQKLLNKFQNAYNKAPNWQATVELLSKILHEDEKNLFRFIWASITAIANRLKIRTELRVSSTIEIDHSLRGESKVLAICKALNATSYINPPGGVDLYNRERFASEGINLSFLHPRAIRYRQLTDYFVENLSIIDVIMFASEEEITNFLTKQFSVS